MDEIEVHGLRIAYERAGDGPPVALAHGFVGTGTSTWAPQIDALSRDYTVIAWDAPGAGRSSDAPAEFRAEDYADCWVAFLGALGLSHAHLVGLSFGGIVALSVVERQPAVPTSLALVGAYAGWRGSLPAAEVEERLSRCLQVSELPGRRVRPCHGAVDVLGGAPGVRSRGVHAQRAGLQPSRVPDDGTGVRGGRPPARPAADRGPDAAPLRRRGCPCSAARRGTAPDDDPGRRASWCSRAWATPAPWRPPTR